MPPPEKIESKQTVGDTGGKQFASPDIGRTGTTQLDRQSAENNLTKINDKVDPTQTSKIAKDTYTQPDNANDRNAAAKNMREAATPTGSVAQRTILDQSGKKLDGLESVDKKTGERSLYVKNGENFDQYKSKDGKEWAKTDSQGKPTGEIIRPQEKQQSQSSADLLSERIAHQEQQKQPSAQRDLQTEQQKPNLQNQPDKQLDQQAQRQAQQNQLREPQQAQQHELPQNPHNQTATQADLLAQREAHRVQQTEAAPPRADLNKPVQNAGDKTPTAQAGGQPQDFSPRPVKNDNRPDAGGETQKTRPDNAIEQGRPHNQQTWQQQQQPQRNEQAPVPKYNEQPVRPAEQAQRTFEPQRQYDPNVQGNRPAGIRFDGQRPDGSWQQNNRPDAQRYDRPGMQPGDGPRNWDGNRNQPGDGPRNWNGNRNQPGDGPRNWDGNRNQTGDGPRNGDRNQTSDGQRALDQSRADRSFDPNRGGRPDFIRPDQIQAKQIDGTMPGGRPMGDGFRGPGLDSGRPGQGLDGRAPGLDFGRGMHPVDGRGLQPGDLGKGLLPGQLPIDGKLIFNLKAEMNGGRLPEFQRGDLQNQFMHNLRTLNQDQLLTINRSLSTQQSDLSIRGLRPGMEAERAGVQTGKAIDGMLASRDLATGRMLNGESVGKQIANWLDAVNKSFQLDRVPGADQSRLVLKEMFSISKLDQNNLQESMQIQRSLNMRNAENGIQQTLTMKPQQMEAIRELLNAVKNQDLITKDPSKVNDSAHTIDSKTVANVLTTKQGAEADNASKQEQNKAIKDALAQGKQQEANNLPDRRLVNSETKAESNQVKNNNAENGPGNKANQKEEDKKDKADQIKGKKQEQSAEELATILAASKLRELKEREAKEKEKQKEKDQEKNKKDPQQKTRLKYQVKEGDTLSAIAAKFLHDAQLAPAIFHINRTVIPVITHNEKTYASLPTNQMIWIPCDDDLDTFKDTGVGKQYGHIGFAGVKYASAEEELSARFGRRWFGPSKEELADKGTRVANIEKMLGRDEEIKRPQLKGDADKRRANIESVLGPLHNRPSDGRVRYTVRLGETLKSIAVKHPAMNNVEAWKLLASVNGLSTETDSKGMPIAVIKRGTVIVLPRKEEMEKFIAERKLPQMNFAPQNNALLASM